MSSILKALRKLEEEKAALGEGSVDISRDILKRSARKEPTNYWPITSGVLLFLLLGSGFLMWSSTRNGSAPLENSAVPAQVSEPVPAPASAEVLVKPPENGSTALQTERAPAEKILAQPQVAKLPSSTLEPPPRAHVEPQALQADGAPFLHLSGIAYRENSEERIAIINDLPVMQGTAIEGAQLIEIRPDRVVLSRNGALFSLRIEGVR